MTCLDLCLVLIDTLSHLTGYLMCTHALKLEMTLLLLTYYYFPYLLYPNMLCSDLSFHQTLWHSLSLNKYLHTCPDIFHIILSGVLPKSNSLNSFPPSVFGFGVYIYLLLIYLAFVSLCEIYHVVYNLKHCPKLTIVLFVSSLVLTSLHY